MGLDAASDIALRQRLEGPIRLAAAQKLVALQQVVGARSGALPFKRLLKPVFGPGKVTVDEALYYRLYLGDISDGEALRFVGRRRYDKFHRRCNDMGWYAAANDKALFYTIVSGAGLPAPRTYAVSGNQRRAGYPRFLATKQEIADFLSENRDWPLFLKPIDGMFSIGALKILGVREGVLEVFGVGPVAAPAVADYVAAISTVGYLFQACLGPAAFASAAFGGMVPSIRFLILFSDAVPAIESAVIKIPCGEHAADNYWRSKNMLGALDVETGAIGRVIAGFGVELREHAAHPVTNAQLAGMRIPAWEETCEVVLKAASLFPGVRTQSWDVALAREGPVLLEFNYGGDLNLHQLAHRRGALTASYVEHLRRCGYQGRLS